MKHGEHMLATFHISNQLIWFMAAITEDRRRYLITTAEIPRLTLY